MMSTHQDRCSAISLKISENDLFYWASLLMGQASGIFVSYERAIFQNYDFLRSKGRLLTANCSQLLTHAHHILENAQLRGVVISK